MKLKTWQTILSSREKYTGTFYSVIFASIFILSQVSASPTNSASECRQLSPNSTVNFTTSENLEDILCDGLVKIKFDNQKKRAVLVLGNTGSGKTTLSLILNGNLSRVHAVQVQKGIVIIDDDDRIGLPTTVSKTLYPEYIVNPENNVTFYDCPGFDDNRGPETDIAAMYFLKTVTDHLNQVKFLFTLKHSSVQIGQDGNDFDLLLSHAVKMLKYIDKMNNSIGLVLTKVNSSDTMGDYLSDKVIMNEIVRFIDDFRGTLHQKCATASDATTTDEMRKKIYFIDSLLAKDKISGEFLKIWFIRTPSCGPFHTNDNIIQVRKNITKLYTQNLEYASVTASDFRYTLKPTTILKIRETFVPSLESDISSIINTTINTLKIVQVNGTVEQLRNVGTEKCTAMKNLYEIVVNLNRLESNPNFTSLQYPQRVTQIMEIFGNEFIPEKVLTDLSNKQKWLHFFRTVTNAPEDIVLGETPALNLVFANFFATFEKLYDEMKINILEQASFEILPKFENLLEVFKANYFRQMDEHLSQNMLDSAKQFLADGEKLKHFNSMTLQNPSLGISNIIEQFINLTGNLNVHTNLTQNEAEKNEINSLLYCLEIYENVTKSNLLHFQSSFKSLYSLIILQHFESLQTQWWKTRGTEKLNDLVSAVEEAKRSGALEWLENYKTAFTKRFNLPQTDQRHRRAVEKFERDFAKYEEILENTTSTTFLSHNKTSVDEKELELQSLAALLNVNVTANISYMERGVFEEIFKELMSFRLLFHKQIRDDLSQKLLSDISTEVNDLCSLLTHVYHSGLHKGRNSSIDSIPDILEKLRTDKDSIQNINESQTVTGILTSVSEIIIFNPHLEKLKRMESLLKYYKKLCNIPNHYFSRVTTKDAYVQYLTKYIDFYNFFRQFSSGIESYRGQSETQRLDITHLNDDATGWELLKFLEEETNFFTIPKHVLKMNDDGLLKSQELDVLASVISYATSSTSIDCSDNKIAIKGRFVLLSDFVHDKHLTEKCGNDIKVMEIFATDTIYFDRDLHSTELQYLTFIAPKWEVVEYTRIRLEGVEGTSYNNRAPSGKSYGDRGVDGIPGGPGGNAGNIYGVVQHITNAELLTLSSIGGNGGNGQSGGNGYRGKSGANANKPIQTDSSFLITADENGGYTIHGKLGLSGGNGGDGAMGGAGGYPGEIDIQILWSNSMVKFHELKMEGMGGQDGNGGDGGSGGKNGISYQCRVTIGTWPTIARTTSCHPVRENGEGKDGAPGKNGKVRSSPPTLPVTNTTIFEQAISRFQTFVASEQNQRQKSVHFFASLNTIMSPISSTINV